MRKLNNVVFLLDPKAASRAATANKKTRSAAKVRMASPRARYTKVATQAAKLGKVRYKSNKKSQNLNKIYNSLKSMGIENHASWYSNNINSYIRLYENLRNTSITQKEKDRLERKMIKWKSILLNEIQKRINQYHRLHGMNNLNMSNTERNYNNNWR
jgi:hypothetical protein